MNSLPMTSSFPEPSAYSTAEEESSTPGAPDSTMKTDLPQVISTWRKSSRLKISAAAAALGVSPAAWGHWENGSRFPNASNLALLTTVTGLSLRALLCANYSRCPFRRNEQDAEKA